MYDYWNDFINSGKIEHYLNYKLQTGESCIASDDKRRSNS